MSNIDAIIAWRDAPRVANPDLGEIDYTPGDFYSRQLTHVWCAVPGHKVLNKFPRDGSSMPLLANLRQWLGGYFQLPEPHFIGFRAATFCRQLAGESFLANDGYWRPPASWLRQPLAKNLETYLWPGENSLAQALFHLPHWGLGKFDYTSPETLEQELVVVTQLAMRLDLLQ